MPFGPGLATNQLASSRTRDSFPQAMQDFQQIQDNLAYLDYLLSSAQRGIVILDLMLVTITFFLILTFIRNSRAAVLLRGGLLLALIVVAITSLLPLPTFDWLLFGTLIVGLVATPMIFQPELRRGLERLGRSVGFFKIRPTELVHSVVPVLVRTTGNLSRRRVGALIVLEGETSLAEIISTGVQLRADLSADLLETIFHDKTPLHDGAVVLQEDKVEAAACVLPLSEQVLPGGMHQGTRHRAALGISEQSDALALVVSEETGAISVARNGVLRRDVDAAELREYLYAFYDPRNATAKAQNGASRRRFRVPRPSRPGLPSRRTLIRLVAYAVTMMLAAVLAVVAWLVVADQVNPPQRSLVQGIELRMSNLPAGMVLVGQPPATVSAAIQVPEDQLAEVQPQSFKARVDLADLPAGVHRVPIKIDPPGDSAIRVIEASPVAVDLELQPLESRVMSVTVSIPDRESLPFSYEIEGEPSVNPPEVTVSGPTEILEQLTRAEVTVALRGAKSTLQEERVVVFRDASGNALTGLRSDPESVQIIIPIRQRFNTRDAAVHAVITGTVPSGYWISNIAVEPKTVTLLGPPAVLSEMAGFVDTVPVDVTGAAGDIVRRVPLAPPSGVTALNERGVSEGSVEVRISVVPQLGNLRLTVPVDINGVPEGATVSRSPASVDVILAGPLPVLDQVNADPKLVRVLVDATELGSGTHDVTPTLIAPEALSATMVPNTIQIRIEFPTPVGAAAPANP